MNSVLKQSTVFVSLLIGCQFVAAAHAAGSKESISAENVAIVEKPTQLNFGVNLEPIWVVLSGVGLKFEYFISDTVSVGVGGILIPNHKIESSTSTASSTLYDNNYKYSHYEGLVGTNIMLTGTLGSRGLPANEAKDIVVKDNLGKEVLRERSSSLGGLALDLQVGYVF